MDVVDARQKKPPKLASLDVSALDMRIEIQLFFLSILLLVVTSLEISQVIAWVWVHSFAV